MKFTRSTIMAAMAAAALLFSVNPQGVGAQAATAHTYSTGIQIQNLEATQANITLSFYPENNGTALAPVTDTIPANGQKGFFPLPSAVTAGFSGSAVISSDKKVSAIVNVVGDNFAFGLSSYTGFTGGAKTVGLPLLFKKASNITSFFNVQNVGSAQASVTVSYRGTGGANNAPFTGQEQPITVPAGSTRRLDQGTSTVLPDNFVGSATLTSDQDIVATVVQVGPTTMLGYNGFTSYSKAPAMPLVNTNAFGFITGIAMQNLGSTATDVTVSYFPSSAASGTACTETKTVPANGSTYFALNSFRITEAGENCADGKLFVGAARVTANSTNQDLVAIVNQLNSGTKKGDSYGGVDAGTSTGTVVFPLIQDRVYGGFTGISIMNVGGASVNVTCTFANTTFTQSSPGAIAPNGAFTVVQVNQIGNLYNGSGVCTATSTDPAQPAKIVGIANAVNTASKVDIFSVYNGTNN
jgi:hypothetical protein